MKIPALVDVKDLVVTWARFGLQYEKDTKALAPTVGQVTLTANAATTVLSNATLTPTKKLILTPTTANAAAALATTYWAIGTTAGSVTLNHANNAQSDRIFDYAIVGI